MTTATIICDGGLDLVTAKQEASPGSLRDCLNYEVGNRRGYQKSLGLSGYSGGVVVGVTDPYLFYSTASNGSNCTLATAFFTHGQRVKWGNGGTFRLSDGTLTTYDGRGLICYAQAITAFSRAIYAICAIEGRLPQPGDTISAISGPAATAVMTSDVVPLSQATTLPFTATAATVDGFTNLIPQMDAENTFLGGTGVPVPGSVNGYTSGMFFWRDRLHVITDFETWSFTAGNTEPAVDDSFSIYSSGTYPAGASTTAKVEAVITESGSWAAGTAAGTIIFRPTDALVPQVPVIAPTATRNATAGVTDPFTLGSRKRGSRAGLWRDGGPYCASTDPWERMDLGYEVRFKTGSSVPSILNRANRDPELETAVSYSPAAGAWAAGGTAAGTGWTNPGNATGAPDATVATASLNGVSPVLSITNFGFALPASAVILGVEVRITRGVGAGVINARDFLVDLVGISGTSQNKAKADLWSNGSLSAVTYGSASDGWNANLTASIVNDSAFGVRLRGEAVGGSGGQFQVDSIELRITYKDRSSILYFYDTVNLTDASTGRLIWYYKDKGDWTTSDAEGVMTIYSLSAATSIKEGMQIRTAASGGGTLIATTGSTANKVYLESSTSLDANDSQYEFATGNFFANANAEQVFGVSGAGLAFSWDGTYCIRIRTGVEENSDKPRHVAKHLSQLALGYASGSVMLSDLGYAESFSGVVDGSSPVSDADPAFGGGAAEIAVGDPIYGLLPLPDQSLGVFCRRSIQRISGSGSSVASTVIEPSSGIIEYTLANIGIPVFCDFRGVGTVQATDAFGDFARGRLSDPVAPWLVPRLQESGPSIGLNRGPIRAEIVRAKNQYRVYFRDRYVLTMTLVGNGFDNPQFTFQQIPFVPTTLCSGVSSGGRDRVFCGTFGAANVGSSSNLLFPLYTAAANNYAHNKVYEMEVGSTFDRLLEVDGYIELNGGAVGGEGVNKTFDRLIVSGLMYGFAPFGLTYGVNFGDLETSVANTNAGSLSASAAKAFYEQPFSVSQKIGRNGYALAIKVESQGDSVYGATTAQTAPYKFRPHTVQAVTVLYENNGQRR